MFLTWRLTDRARRVLATAKREAGNRQCDDISVEQLMIALLDESGGVARQILTSAGVDTHTLRQYLASCSTAAPGLAARTIVELAAEEARELGHNYIGTEHLLLAVTVVPGSATHRVSSEHGFDHSEASAMVVAALEDARSRPEWRRYQARRAAVSILFSLASVIWIAYKLCVAVRW